MSPDDLDLDLVPGVVTEVLEAAGYFVELMAPGLALRPDGDDLVVVDVHGADLARFPLERLRRQPS